MCFCSRQAPIQPRNSFSDARKMKNRIRQEIAQEAARIIASSGMDDYLYAKKKAASNMGISDKNSLPSNIEIEAALVEYQTLFDHDQQDVLTSMRETALKAMEFFMDFDPLLSGSVAAGTANEHSEIILHLFDDTSESVGHYLQEKKIPAEICERRLQFRKNNPLYFTTYKFLAGNFEIVAIVLPHINRKQTPLDPVNGKPMQRLKLHQLRNLLNGDTSGQTLSG